ncbi:hypothetical protein [Sphingobium baderi]|uniref:hypothetical protein n=1 Tax=Sphingobium baderi TaxID=1332080 RepID=UPI002B4167F3|nr:hypothetical protein [Sphingobium baderi]WRD77203.1 hypothetical protein QQ987_03425 [Sphingobium baderi]
MDGWIDATFYYHNGQRYAVCYRHLLRADRDRDGSRTFFAFRLHPRNEYDHPLAWEWVEQFAFTAKQTGKVILATLGSQHGYIHNIGISDSGHNQLMMELVRAEPQEEIVMLTRPEPDGREFYPRAFTVKDDDWANSVLDGIGPSREQLEQMRRDEAIFRRRR